MTPHHLRLFELLFFCSGSPAGGRQQGRWSLVHSVWIFPVRVEEMWQEGRGQVLVQEGGSKWWINNEGEFDFKGGEEWQKREILLIMSQGKKLWWDSCEVKWRGFPVKHKKVWAWQVTRNCSFNCSFRITTVVIGIHDQIKLRCKSLEELRKSKPNQKISIQVS